MIYFEKIINKERYTCKDFLNEEVIKEVVFSVKEYKVIQHHPILVYIVLNFDKQKDNGDYVSAKECLILPIQSILDYNTGMVKRYIKKDYATKAIKYLFDKVNKDGILRSIEVSDGVVND